MDEKQVRERLGPPDEIVGRRESMRSGPVKDDRQSCGLPLNGDTDIQIPLILLSLGEMLEGTRVYVHQVWYRGASG